MSNNTTVDIEYKEVDDFLNSLDDDDTRKKIILEGLKKGAKVLQMKTQELFKTRMGGAAFHHSRYLKDKPFYEGVKMIVDKAYNETIVSIMADYRMRFFEKGVTKKRVTKKGYNRGTLDAKHFFRDARESSEQEIDNAVSEGIDTAMRKYLI